MILVVAERSPRQTGVTIAIEHCGYRSILASTPLDAIQYLIDPASTIGAALVAEELPSEHGVHVLRYLAEELPRIVRVLLTDRPANQIAGEDEVCSWRAEDVGAVLARIAVRTRARG